MKTISYNLKQLVSISTYDRKLWPKFLWKGERKYWWRSNKIAGFYKQYYPGDEEWMTERVILDVYLNGRGFIENKKVYFCPRLYMNFSDGTRVGIWRKKMSDIKNLESDIKSHTEELDLSNELNIF